jgi:hypothetical protein
MKIYCKKCKTITRHKSAPRGVVCKKCSEFNVDYYKELQIKDEQSIGHWRFALKAY